MASSYPGSLDAFTSIASDKKTSDVVGGRTHRDMHNDLGDAVEAVQAELGTDPAGAYATVKARLEAIEADSGARNLSAVSLSNGWAVYAAYFVVQRVGKVVMLTGYFDKSGASGDVIYTLPSGFKPAMNVVFSGQSDVADDRVSGFIEASPGTVALTRSTISGTYAYMTATFLTNDAWPVSLPGTAL